MTPDTQHFGAMVMAQLAYRALPAAAKPDTQYHRDRSIGELIIEVMGRHRMSIRQLVKSLPDVNPNSLKHALDDMYRRGDARRVGLGVYKVDWKALK